MRIFVNGKQHDVPADMTVKDLLGHLSVDADAVAVARNGVIVSRTRYVSLELRDDDTVQLLNAVAGG